MKSVGSAFVAGLLGVVIGSLTAQERPTDNEPADNRPLPAGAIYAGTVEAISLDRGEILGEGERVVVFDGWVFLPNLRQFYPREEVAVLTLNRTDPRPADDFGDQPGSERRGFRED